MNKTPKASRRLGLLTAALLAAPACQTAEGDGEGDGTEDVGEGEGEGDGDGCEEAVAATTPLRRMSEVQYQNTVHDLFHGVVTASEAFPESDASYHYSNDPEANIVTQLKAEAIMIAAEEVGAAVADSLDAVWQCPAAVPDEAACAAEFIDRYGERAFRRPLRADERAVLQGVYDEARGDALDHPEAIGVVVATLLQMPQFLYFIEEGEDDPDLPAGVIRLSDHEIATRLSYLLWDTMPDEPLLAAAAAGELSTPAQIEAQARRLLDDPRARPAVGRFFREWLDTRELDATSKDPELYPGYDQTLTELMLEEFDRFVAGVVFDSDERSLELLLTSPLTEVDGTLAAFYGVPPELHPPPGEWTPVALDPDQRPGVLTRAAVLAEHANQATSSAVFRGHLVRAEVLCDFIPPPPANAMAMAGFPPGSTQREQSEILEANPDCGGCHIYMNPIGLGFEHYDAIGAWREQDNDAPVDASGEVLVSASNIGGTFVGADELMQMLAADPSGAVHACAVRQWMRHAYGRDEAECLADDLGARFSENQGDLYEMMVAFVVSDSFAMRRLPEVMP